MAVVDHITACPLDCPDTCSLTVTVTDGRITKVDAAPGNPITDGFICQKVKHHAQRVYAPERILTPQIRTGPKGSGEFRAASWDEALDLVVDRLRTAEATTGPESVVPYTYNSSAPALQHEVGERLLATLRCESRPPHGVRGHLHRRLLLPVREHALGRSARRDPLAAHRDLGREPDGVEHAPSAARDPRAT